MRFALVLASFVVASLVTACPKGDAPSSTGAAAPVAGPAGDVLTAYEGARAKLAADDLGGALPFAEQIAAAAKKDAALADIATAADKMKGAADIAAARLAFGDVSKAVIAVLVANPSWQAGRHLMLCPMAKGYQKWVQTTPKLTNPYWGKEMLECGEELKSWSV